MWLRSSIGNALRHVGVDVKRYPEAHELWRVAQLLRSERVDVVLDVGANDGDYARSLRRCGYRGRIVSFEPLRDPFARLEAATSNDPLWVARRCALGDANADVVINVAGNAGASSSVLPMLAAHVEAAPEASFVATEKVLQRRLDDLVPELSLTAESRVFLKLDVQGYERHVLEGAQSLLASEALRGLQLGCR